MGLTSERGYLLLDEKEGFGGNVFIINVSLPIACNYKANYGRSLNLLCGMSRNCRISDSRISS
jgi:hypothetical protein